MPDRDPGAAKLADSAGLLAARAALYDTGSSWVEVDIGPVGPSIVTLWIMSGFPGRFQIRAREGSSWVEVSTTRGGLQREYAIWRATGDIYEVEGGAVRDEPLVKM